MTIRQATTGDLDAILALGERMHLESPRYSKLAFDADKVRRLFADAVADDRYLILVAEEEDGQIIGGFAGFVMEHWSSPDMVAQDLALFVKPDRRGGILAARMIKAFISWAQDNGAKQTVLGISTGVHVEQAAQLYKALGLKQFGYLFEV